MIRAFRGERSVPCSDVSDVKTHRHDGSAAVTTETTETAVTAETPVGLGALLESAEHHGKDDQDHDQQQHPQQAAARPRSRPAPPAPAPAPAAVLAAAGHVPVHKHVYSQAPRNMPSVPNYLNPPG